METGPDAPRTGADVVLRPMTDADVPAARAVSWESLREAGTRYGWSMPELTDALAERGHAHFRHVLAHDPDGAVVAERDGAVAGVALATRRGPLWFLSLLTVALGLQGTGVGARLLAAVRRTRGDLGAICASDDPKALRRYHAEGFALHPAFEARGSLDRSTLPAVRGVRDGAFDDDRDLVEDVARAIRGAGHGPDLDLWAATGRRLHVADGPAGRGYAVGGTGGPLVVAATAPAVAADLYRTCLAEATESDLELLWVTAAQPWAVDVLLASRFSLRPSGTLCLLGAGPGSGGAPWAPYVPNGSLG